MCGVAGKIIHGDLDNIYSRDIPWEKMRDSTVLVTGAYGMLASYVTYMLIYLNEEKHMNIKIIAAVRSMEKFQNRFQEYARASYMIPCLKTLDDSISIEEDVDYIIHAASFASPQYYSVCPVDVLRPNVIGNYNLLEFAVKKKVKGYLLFSTGDIYGRVRGVDNITENDCGIMDTLDIHSCYGEGKRLAETMCNAYFHQYHVPVKILRIFHTYAPTMDVENDPRVFASFVKNVLNDEDIVMKSDGHGKRCFCYIADAAAAYFTVLLKGQTGEAYNVCNTEEFYSIKQFAEIIATLGTGKKRKVIVTERDKNECYVENTTASGIPPSNEKLKALGWRPQYDVKTGFTQVIRYLSNKT